MFKNPAHLGLGATAEVEPEFTGALEWYMGYAQRHASDGVEGRLVDLVRLTESRGMWGVHPKGFEAVLCVAGSMTLHQDLLGGSRRSVTIGSGDYVINEPGVWHTADIDTEATALFITAGEGTEGRPR
jgi:quercetin dioxygenase-like cupin family protein